MEISKKLLTFLVFSITISCNALFKDKLIDIKNKVSSIAKDIGLSYLTAFAITTAHELGHALTIKLLVNGPVSLNIGGYMHDKTLINFFDIFKIKGLNCTIGYTTHQVITNPIKKIITSAAGPIFGSIASILALKLLFKKRKNNYILTKLLCFYGLINNAIYQFIPEGHSDGAHIFEAIKEIRNPK